MLDVSHFANAQNGAETFVFNALGANDWQSWTKPRGKSMALMVIIGGGGGGGGGFTGAAATARGGGGGGGSGQVARVLMPIFALPDTLVIRVPIGGLGGAANAAGSAATQGYINFRPDALFANIILTNGSTGAGGGGAGTAAIGGAGGAASGGQLGGQPTMFGVLATGGGAAGGAGGAQTGAVGTSIALGSTSFLSGGAGGGGTTSADFAGGNITGSGWLPTLNGGTSGFIRGADGFYSPSPFGATAGAGGAGINTTIGGDGGNAAMGCGGGGGGGGTTGGKGGNGGNGLVILSCW